MPPEGFPEVRERALTLCLRMDARSGLRSLAAYCPQRASPALLALARAAEEQNVLDRALLDESVRRGLEQHAPAMLAWAESALTLACTETYVRGWKQVLAAWRQGETEPEEPEVSFPWLVALWERARRA